MSPKSQLVCNRRTEYNFDLISTNIIEASLPSISTGCIGECHDNKITDKRIKALVMAVYFVWRLAPKRANFEGQARGRKPGMKRCELHKQITCTG
jgi:hypothetical protein